jgi:hypothetical protein
LEGQSRGDEEPGTGVRASPGLGLQRVSGRRAREPPGREQGTGGYGQGGSRGSQGNAQPVELASGNQQGFGHHFGTIFGWWWWSCRGWFLFNCTREHKIMQGIRPALHCAGLHCSSITRHCPLHPSHPEAQKRRKHRQWDADCSRLQLVGRRIMQHGRRAQHKFVRTTRLLHKMQTT